MFSRHWQIIKNLSCKIGEDGGLIRLWNIAPVTDEEIEDDDGVPKVLSQMDDHTGGSRVLLFSVNSLSASVALIETSPLIWTANQ